MNSEVSIGSRWLLLAVAALIACLPLVGCGSGNQPPQEPTATASAMSPREMVLAKFLRDMDVPGKPALIEFGTVGCALSEKGLEGMMALQRDGTIPGLAMIRVEGNQDAAVVDGYFKAKGMPFRVYKDGSTALAQALGATAYPTFLLADKFGHIRYVGAYPQENLVPWGKALVAETTDPGRDVPMFGARAVDLQALLARQLPDLKGQARAIKDHAGDHGLLLLFVDTTCPFSAIALKELPTVSQVLADKKINCLLVNTDDPKAKVLEFYAGKELGAPVVYDTGATTRESLNVQSVPIAVFITPSDTIGYQGEAVWAKLGTAIEKALGLAAGAIRFTAEGTGYG